MFSITVTLSGEQQEPKYYSKDTTCGAMQYTAYLQRLDGILAGWMRNVWKISRWVGENIQEPLDVDTVGCWPRSTSLLSKIRGQKRKDLKHTERQHGGIIKILHVSGGVDHAGCSQTQHSQSTLVTAIEENKHGHQEISISNPRE